MDMIGRSSEGAIDMVKKKLETLKDMMNANIDLARMMRDDGMEVEASIMVKDHGGQVDLMNVSVLTSNKDALSSFIKQIGADPRTDAIVFMCEAWVTKIDVKTKKPSERTEVVNIIGETADGEGYHVYAPIVDGKMGEPEWMEIGKETQHQGRLANFFSERKKSSKDDKDWNYYIG